MLKFIQLVFAAFLIFGIASFTGCSSHDKMVNTEEFEDVIDDKDVESTNDPLLNHIRALAHE